MEKKKVEFQKQITKRESAYYAMKEIVDMQLENEGRRIQSDNIVYEDGKELYHLKDVVKYGCIVVRFSQNNCQSCISTLMALFHKLNMKNVTFFINYANEHFLDDLKKYKVQSRFFKVGMMPLPIDSLNLPYCFIVDREMKVSNIFIPNIEYLDQTIQYFEMANRCLLH